MEDEADLTGATPRRRPKPGVLEIGGRRLKPSTLMMGHGFDPALSEGSLKPPIFLTSTFVFENAAAGKRHFEGVTGKRPGGAEGLVYSRFNGPNQEILEDRLSVWENAEDALSFSSGMSAISTLLLTFVQPGDVVVHSGPLYAATETLIGRILGRFGVKWLDFPAGATREEIESVIERAKAMGRVSLIYLESPANPTNALVDVEAVAAARDALFDEQRPPIAIDNTFLGPLWAKPLDQGADLSIYSLTKYAGGHSDLVAGAVVGAEALITPIRMMRNTIGTITDPNTAWMLLRSLETLELRMSKAGENAARICAWLRDQPQVETVLPRRPQDRPSRGQPRRHGNAGQRSGRDDPFVRSRRAQAGARDHRQSGSSLDRSGGCRRSDRRFRAGVGGDLGLWGKRPTSRHSGAGRDLVTRGHGASR
jgi:methionine-gamma-lyase